MSFSASLNRPNEQCYENFNHRLSTFLTWDSLHVSQSAESLAMAGFFRCNNTDDSVQCHVCNVRLYAWIPSDVPLTEHERWSPYCPFIPLVKTQKSGLLALLVYILPLITTPERQSMLRRDPNLCIKCTIDPISVELWPCRHKLTCVICSIDISRCPRCNVLVTQKNRINE